MTRHLLSAALTTTALLAAVSVADAKPNDRDPKQNTALMKEVFETVFNKHDLTDGTVHRYYSATYIQHNQEAPPGRDGFQKFFGALFAAFPDWTARVDHYVAEGDRVATFVTWTGTHTGPFNGVPPTGKKVTIHTADLFRIQNGKIAEHWDVVDANNLLATMGQITFNKRPEPAR